MSAIIVSRALLNAMYLQLAGKWKHAANKYRVDNPGVLPDSKYQQGVPPNRRLLPVEVAEQKMRMWIPWAIQRIRNDLDALAAQFAQLNADQVQQIDAEEAEHVSDDEDV
jgi:hypothetical protein